MPKERRHSTIKRKIISISWNLKSKANMRSFLFLGTFFTSNRFFPLPDEVDEDGTSTSIASASAILGNICCR